MNKMRVLRRDNDFKAGEIDCAGYKNVLVQK